MLALGEVPVLIWITAIIVIIILLIYYFKHFSQVNHLVAQAVSAVVDWFKSLGKRIWSIIKDVGGFIAAFSGLGDKIKTTLGDGALVLFKWGSDLVHGLWNGVKSFFTGGPAAPVRKAPGQIGARGTRGGRAGGVPQPVIPNKPAPVPGAKLPTGSLVSKAPGVSTLPKRVTGRWSGGNVFPIKDYLVGEKGPELFRNMLGAITEIGTHGPEIMKFDMPGVVIPNNKAKDYREPMPVSQHSSSRTQTYVEGANSYNANIALTGIDEAQARRIFRSELMKMQAQRDETRNIGWRHG